MFGIYATGVVASWLVVSWFAWGLHGVFKNGGVLDNENDNMDNKDFFANPPIRRVSYREYFPF